MSTRPAWYYSVMRCAYGHKALHAAIRRYVDAPAYKASIDSLTMAVKTNDLEFVDLALQVLFFELQRVRVPDHNEISSTVSRMKKMVVEFNAGAVKSISFGRRASS